jgi:hypothetical protein
VLKLKADVPLETLIKYGFFKHTTGDYWLVLNKRTRNINNVELSLRVLPNRLIRVYATNDHKKLPSIFSKRYNKDNYLEFEEQLDAFSFEDFGYCNVLFEMIVDNIVEKFTI